MQNSNCSKGLILADFYYVILHKISDLLVYISFVLQFVLGPAIYDVKMTGLKVTVELWLAVD